MKANEWITLIKNDTFESAHQNMAYDEMLLNSLEPYQRVERFYVWKNPGITLSYKQNCPAEMEHLDSSKRITGGGIVFHSPGDIVFSIISWQNDPKYPLKMKDKLHQIAHRVRSAIKKIALQIDNQPTSSAQNIAFCQTYPTPFEISIQGQKVLGLTIRQFKSKWLVQGVIHTKPTHSSLIKYTPTQISCDLDSRLIINDLIR